MQTSSKFKSQRGAVLAFSLVMLLLLTLAGTRMIQQNKQQLEMANSDRLITQEFANAEGVLANGKTLINGVVDFMPQHIDPTDTAINSSTHQCVTLPTSYKQNIGLAGAVPITMPNTTVTILSASCMSSTGTITKCTDYNTSNSKLTCYPKSASSSGVDCTGNSIDAIAALFTDPSDVCYQPYDPLCTDPRGGSDSTITDSLNVVDNYNPNPRCRLAPPNPLTLPSCPKEVYKVDAIATSANGTTREIVSDHVVGCGT